MFQQRQHEVRRPIENPAHRSRTVAAKGVLEEPDRGDARADSGVETKRALMLPRETLEISAERGHERLVRGDEGAATRQRVLGDCLGRLDAAECLHHDLGVGIEEIVERRREQSFAHVAVSPALGVAHQHRFDVVRVTLAVLFE